MLDQEEAYHGTSSQNPPPFPPAVPNSIPRRTGSFAKCEHAIPSSSGDDGVIRFSERAMSKGLITDQRTGRSKPSCCVHRRRTGTGHGSRFQHLLFSNGETHRRRRQPAVARLRLPEDGGVRRLSGRWPRPESTRSATAALLKLRDEFAALLRRITIAAILGIPRADVPVFTALS